MRLAAATAALALTPLQAQSALDNSKTPPREATPLPASTVTLHFAWPEKSEASTTASVCQIKDGVEVRGKLSSKMSYRKTGSGGTLTWHSAHLDSTDPAAVAAFRNLAETPAIEILVRPDGSFGGYPQRARLEKDFMEWLKRIMPQEGLTEDLVKNVTSLTLDALPGRDWRPLVEGWIGFRFTPGSERPFQAEVPSPLSPAVMLSMSGTLSASKIMSCPQNSADNCVRLETRSTAEVSGERLVAMLEAFLPGDAKSQQEKIRKEAEGLVFRLERHETLVTGVTTLLPYERSDEEINRFGAKDSKAGIPMNESRKSFTVRYDWVKP